MSDAFLPDGDPRTLTRHGVGPVGPTALPDLDSCTPPEYCAFLTAAMHDPQLRARIAGNERHLWTVINNVLALTGELAEAHAELDEERRRTERQAAAANRHALEAARLQALHAQLSRDYIKVCEAAQTADQERVESRLAMRPLLRELGDALAELDAKDAEIRLLKSFDAASRTVTGMPAARLSAHLACPSAAESFGAEQRWLAAGTDPANETVVVDVPLDGGVG